MIKQNTPCHARGPMLAVVAGFTAPVFLLAVSLLAASLLTVSCAPDLHQEQSMFPNEIGCVCRTEPRSKGQGETTLESVRSSGLGIFAYHSAKGAEFSGAIPSSLYLDNRQMVYMGTENSADRYRFSPKAYWPSEGSLTFFAYAPYMDGFSLDSPGTGLFPTGSFTVDSDAASQKDLCLARPVFDCDASKGDVALNFSHALTQVLFYVRIDGPLPPSTEYKLRSLRLEGLAGTGTFSFDTGESGFSWTTLRRDDPSVPRESSYLLTREAGTLSDALISTGDDYSPANLVTAGRLYLMPQEIGPSARVSVTAESYPDGGGTPVTVFEGASAVLPSSPSWQSGKTIIYTLKLLPPAKLEVSVDVSDEWDEDDIRCSYIGKTVQISYSSDNLKIGRNATKELSVYASNRSLTGAIEPYTGSLVPQISLDGGSTWSTGGNVSFSLKSSASGVYTYDVTVTGDIGKNCRLRFLPPSGTPGRMESYVSLKSVPTPAAWLTFSSPAAGSTVRLGASAVPVTEPVLYYSTDQTEWEEWDRSTLSFGGSDKVYICGSNDSFSSTSNAIFTFVLSGNGISCSGNIMSLLDCEDPKTYFPGSAQSRCFCQLFSGCTTLVSAPSLPATVLREGCYLRMFNECRSLVSPPELPATVLAKQCYAFMFSQCTSLTAAPALNAENMAVRCYNGMFDRCSALTTPPVLPSTHLDSNCYAFMFDGSGITVAPELPATQLAQCCYEGMFRFCGHLSAIPTLPATTLKKACYRNMFEGCSGISVRPVLPATVLAEECYENMFQGCSNLTEPPDLPVTELQNNCYYSMFADCSRLSRAPELPATVMKASCYYSMFLECTSLTAPAVVAATTLAPYCFRSMYSGCTNLLSAPQLPFTALEESCYSEMFKLCKRLTVAPELPATTLAKGCYSYMFQGCTALTEAPELMALTLVSSCYSYMFDQCTSLNKVKAMFLTTPGSDYTRNWLSSVASSGTFIKNPDATWNVSGNSGIPASWTITLSY